MNKIVVLLVVLPILSCSSPSATTNQQQETDQPVSLATVVSSNLSSEVKTQVKDVFTIYLSLKDQLVDDNFMAAKQDAGLLIKGVERINLKSVTERERAFLEQILLQLIADLSSFSTAIDVKGQREVFSAISTNLLELIKQSSMVPSKVYQQYCPMAFNNQGAFWLSTDTFIRNPYFGDEMLECGEIAATYSFN